LGIMLSLAACGGGGGDECNFKFLLCFPTEPRACSSQDDCPPERSATRTFALRLRRRPRQCPPECAFELRMFPRLPYVRRLIPVGGPPPRLRVFAMLGSRTQRGRFSPLRTKIPRAGPRQNSPEMSPGALYGYDEAARSATIGYDRLPGGRLVGHQEGGNPSTFSWKAAHRPSTMSSALDASTRIDSRSLYEQRTITRVSPSGRVGRTVDCSKPSPNISLATY